MPTTVKALAATAAKAALQPYEYQLGALGHDQVDIAVEYCGICHSDLSVLDNEWGISSYPFVPGHEIVGRVEALGAHVTHLKVGQRVGVGWHSGSCATCQQCLSGDHNLCAGAEAVMLGRHGGFANRVRVQGIWATPLPEAIDAAKAGPLFCGGITVFNPIVQFGVKPTDRVGVVGIGGLGHMALGFLRAWGCEVTAFTSSDNKRDEALKLGAHHTINSRNSDEVKAARGRFDFILVTVNVSLDWQAYFDALAPRGRLHVVGAVLEPIPAVIFPMILGQKSLSASPLGSPATTATMLNFAARHKLAPVTQEFPMSKANEALEHLRAGKARYRVVLRNDLG